MSIRSCLISQLKNKLISNNEQVFNTTDSLSKTFRITLSLNTRGKNSANFQINLGITSENKSYKVYNIKILLNSGASVIIGR